MSIINPALLPHDLEDLRAAAEVVFQVNMAASAAANAAWNAGDDTASKAADVEYDASSRVLALIEARIHEIEEAGRSDEPTGFRAMYAVIK